VTGVHSRSAVGALMQPPHGEIAKNRNTAKMTRCTTPCAFVNRRRFYPGASPAHEQSNFVPDMPALSAAQVFLCIGTSNLKLRSTALSQRDGWLRRCRSLDTIARES
jgi:hypothetical protein